MKKIIMMCLLVTTWLLSLRGMEIPIDQPSDSEFWPEEYLRLMEAVNQWKIGVENWGYIQTFDGKLGLYPNI